MSAGQLMGQLVIAVIAVYIVMDLPDLRKAVRGPLWGPTD